VPRFTPDCATWPKEGTIEVPKIDRKPICRPLEYRGGDFPIARQGEFANHPALNGANHAMSDEAGRQGRRAQPGAHLRRSGAPDKYYKEHPE